MGKLFDLVQMFFAVVLSLCAIASTVAQWVLAGEFRWYLLLFALMAAGSVALVAEAWKEFKTNH